MYQTHPCFARKKETRIFERLSAWNRRKDSHTPAAVAMPPEGSLGYLGKTRARKYITLYIEVIYDEFARS
jgi:hypothetical protein